MQAPVLDNVPLVATMAIMATKVKYLVVPAKEAKNRFGELLDTAQRRPVIITKKGRPVARMIAFVDKERFEEVEDQIWGERAMKAEKEEGYLGPKKSMEALKRMLRHANTRSR